MQLETYPNLPSLLPPSVPNFSCHKTATDPLLHSIQLKEHFIECLMSLQLHAVRRKISHSLPGEYPKHVLLSPILQKPSYSNQ